MKAQLKGCTDSEEGGFNTGALWKLKKKLSPKQTEPPTAMKDSNGKILTNDKDIQKEAMKHYQEVFTDKSIGKEYEQHRKEREALCMKRLEECSRNKTPDWSVEDVTDALKCLKTGKSKDPYDIPNELFKPNVAGTNLILAITKLMNRIKSELIFPTPLNVANVTNLYKNKGEKNIFDSYRGIFRIPILRNILELLMHRDEYETIDNNLTNCNVGARRRRNVRDNLFVMNAIMNESKQTKEATDIDVYDVKKCFDNLWLLECINDLYEAGMKNDKLNLLYLANRDARIVIKTSSGKTEQMSISNTAMQGTVWAGLMCTATMDKLCKRIYKEDNLLYKYRQEVSVPPLEMVDDIITASKCGTTAVTLNAMVTTFVDQKKLKLSDAKCKKIHIGSKHSRENCDDHFVNGKPMEQSDKEKYLGDYLTSAANSKETVKERKARGYAVLSQMHAILSDIPLGKYRTEMGLELRHAWFLNGVLFNSEVWTGISENDLNDLAVIDHKILRLITGAQSKVNTEMLYLETGEMILESVISVRRILYFHTLLKRHDSEITKQIFKAMEKAPLKDDWIHLVIKDLEKINLSLKDANEIKAQDKMDFKKLVKQKMRKHTLNLLEKTKLRDNCKIKNIKHQSLSKPQKYLTNNNISNKLKKLIFNLRSKCENFKDNFHALYATYECDLCGNHIDSQENAMSCETVLKHMNIVDIVKLKEVDYSFVDGSCDQQHKLAQVYQSILKVREEMKQEKADRGNSTGPAADY
jgi:hypothetical protein